MCHDDGLACHVCRSHYAKSGVGADLLAALEAAQEALVESYFNPITDTWWPEYAEMGKQIEDAISKARGLADRKSK